MKYSTYRSLWQETFRVQSSACQLSIYGGHKKVLYRGRGHYCEAAAQLSSLHFAHSRYIYHHRTMMPVGGSVHALILHEIFLFIKVSQQGFDLILLSRVIYYCNYIFCNIVKHFTLINKNHQRKHFSITSQLTQYDHCSIAHMSNIVQL